MIRRLILAAAPVVAALATPLAAQMPQYTITRMPTPAQPDAIPLYPAGSLPAGATPEVWDRVGATMPDGTRVDSRMARNVAIPTMTPVLPDPAKATGAAIVVAPGGAFMSLSMESEGFEIARRLAAQGIAAFVLKYRLNPTPDDEAAFQLAIGKRMGEAIAQGGAVADIGEPRAAPDALQALKLVREGATKWRVDPKRVGIIGFSAGAMTALQSALTGQGAARPAFVGYIYGPMVAVPVPAGAPPLFAALALDDPLFGKQGFGIIDAWRKAGVPVELHAYERGDHGFGVGKPGTTSVGVMDQFVLWMRSRGLLAAAGK